MKNMTTKEAVEELALARYAVIAPLVCRQMGKDEYSAELKRVVALAHHFPDGVRRVSRRTVSRWCRYHREGREGVAPGLDALKPQIRADIGQPRVLEPKLVQRAVELREEAPTRKTGRIIEMLEREAKLENRDLPQLSESTLNYHFRARRATRKKLRGKSRAFRRFEHPHRNSCWQGDMTDGIWLPHPTQPGKYRKCHLHAFIDDRTRYIPHAEFYFRQNLPCLEDCYRKAILKGGIPEMTYVDNGAAYQAKQFKKLAARLTTNLVFATPFCPEGKGKIERWNRTLKEDFLDEAGLSEATTLVELNTFFWSWLENVYHLRKHTTTKRAPRELWEAEASRARIIEPEKLVDIFLWEETRKVDRAGTFQLNSNRYPVSEHLVSETVEVRFNPFDLEKVRVYRQGLFVEVVSPEKLVNRTHTKAVPRRHDKRAPLESSKAYRRQLSQEYQDEIRDALSALPDDAEGKTYLTELRFKALLRTKLSRESLRVSERNQAHEFFQHYAPLPTTLVSEALTTTVAEKGNRLHLRVYLRRIQEAVVSGRGAL